MIYSKFPLRVILSLHLILLSGVFSSCFGSLISDDVVLRFPANQAKEVNPDTHLELTFKTVPVLGNSGEIRIFDVASGRLVDRLDMSIAPGPTTPDTTRGATYTPIAYPYLPGHFTNANTRPGTPSGVALPNTGPFQLSIIGGFTDGFHFYPVLIRDKKAIITLHNNLLEYGKSYYVEIDPGVLSLDNGSFKGFSGPDGWTFTTKSQAPVAGKQMLMVSADGSADFNTVQGAIDYIPDNSPQPYIVLVKKGIYDELVYFRNKTNLTIVGEDRDGVVVQYANNEIFNPHPVNVKTNEVPGTFPSRRAAFAVDNCKKIHLKNLTIKNLSKGQAEGLLLNGEDMMVTNVTVIGSGDALQSNGPAYFSGCRIVGDGDTVLGRGPAFFKDCTLESAGTFMWIRNTEANHGNVFVGCKFVATGGRETDLARCPTNHGKNYPYSEAVLIDCSLSGIVPEGWGNIGGETSNIRYWEYNSTNPNNGSRVDVTRRHPASRQLTMENDSVLIARYRDPAFVLGRSFADPTCARKPSNHSALVMSASQKVSLYHQREPNAGNVVKVVYFHAKDQQPLNNWEERLNRTLDDVSHFYREEFNRFGLKSMGIPFEKRNGKMVIHVVEGDERSQNYTKDSGLKIQNEIHQKTKGLIDLTKDHVLVLNGLCDKRSDSTYVFHSPYYGTGSAISGICFVADCEMLDSKWLTNTEKRMKFSEMFVELKECLIAEFNSWYIGGIAHEMGHMFGLPHDFGGVSELDDSNLSLMGQYGSRHFRDELWGGKPSSVFTAASMLQLLSHPTFTQSNKNRKQRPDFELLNRVVDNDPSGLVLKLTMKAGGLPYGVVALVRPSNGSEYFNKSFISLVSDPGSTTMRLGQLGKGSYLIRLLFLYENGEVPSNQFVVDIDSYGLPKIQDGGRGTVDIPKLYEKLLKVKDLPGVKERLEILEGILNPAPLVDPGKCPDYQLSLSDATWEKASVGWEKVARNYFTCEYETTFFLENQGVLYKKGLYAHSPSSYIFNLDAKWSSFSAVVGLRDMAHIQGSAKFTVLGDGKVLYQSSALRANQQSKFNISVRGVKKLELKAEGTEGHNHNSWAVWFNPLLVR